MKKTIAKIIVAILIIVATMMTLTACTDTSSTNNNSRTQLTMSNYDQYLNVKAMCIGTGTRLWSESNRTYIYDSVATGVTVSSTSSMIKFYDCEIEVKVIIGFLWGFGDTKIIENTLKVKLDFGGGGNESTVDSCKNDFNNYGHGFGVVSCSVVAVSGFIEII